MIGWAPPSPRVSSIAAIAASVTSIRSADNRTERLSTSTAAFLSRHDFQKDGRHAFEEQRLRRVRLPGQVAGLGLLLGADGFDAGIEGVGECAEFFGLDRAAKLGQLQFFLGEPRLDPAILGGQTCRGVLQFALDALAEQASGEKPLLVEDEDTRDRCGVGLGGVLRRCRSGQGHHERQREGHDDVQRRHAPSAHPCRGIRPHACQNRVWTVKSKSRVRS